MKTKIDIDYSIIYQNEKFRKEIKGILDTLIYKIQKASLGVGHYHKKLEEDFRQNLKYTDLTPQEIKGLQKEILEQLKIDQVRVEKLKMKVKNLQS